MKIKKIKKIGNFGIFRNFEWDNELSYLQDHKKETYDFKDINIFYGRNYSGKTTISKIFRALETKTISSKYENTHFEILLNDNTTIDQSNFVSFSYPIYVYNSDFLKENLKFIHDGSQDIESFSVTLGHDNQEVLEYINKLNDELGVDKPNEETKIYLSIKEKQKKLNDTKELYENKQKELNALLSNKATKGKNSIKYQPEKYGDQNYNIIKLTKNDIPVVLNSTYQILDKKNKDKYEKLILEIEKKAPSNLPIYNKNYKSIVKSVQDILHTQVGQSRKIDELINDGQLNKWVEDGMKYHEKRNICAFCSNSLSSARLDALRNHFDEESKRLKERILKDISYIEKEKNSMTINIEVRDFYETFHPKLDELKTELSILLQNQIQSFDTLISYLKNKQEQLFSVMEFSPPIDYSEEIIKNLQQIEEVRQDHIKFTAQLTEEQKQAKDKLRLDNIYNFLNDINYDDKIKEIKNLKENIQLLEDDLQLCLRKKENILNKIKLEENKLKSEGEACNRINDILHDDFGHNALSLEAKETGDYQDKIIKFEIKRNGIKAHNLSEGESSLIAFCYFLVKIQDALEQGKKPFIWIDDPISSLDSNHIFFIFSLIQDKICKDKKFEQLFISTHSLEFFKYLRRIDGVDRDQDIVNSNFKENKRKCSYYLIERDACISTIKYMPIYMIKYITEFNFLFDQIYKCATVENIDDSNFSLFYNFGNNARKFLEIYSFYKFPSLKSNNDNMLKEFWGNNLYYTITNRVHNEYSHLCGVLERGGNIIEQPEMKKSAIAIIHKVQQDIKQYEALLESISIDPKLDPLYPKDIKK